MVWVLPVVVVCAVILPANKPVKSKHTKTKYFVFIDNLLLLGGFAKAGEESFARLFACNIV
jgi:hypothetical protein